MASYRGGVREMQMRRARATLFLSFLILILIGIIIYTAVTFHKTEPDPDFRIIEQRPSSSEVISSSQPASSSDLPESSEPSSAASSEDSSDSTSSSGEEQSSAASSEASSESPASSESSSSAFTGTYDFGSPVPQSSRVTADYYNSVVFVGDSITEGIMLYDVVAEAAVVAKTGLNPLTALNGIVGTDAAGNELTLIDALKKDPRANIYIMLGANGMEFIELNNFIETYGKLIDKIRATFPEAKIYVQSILPVTSAFAANRPNLTNTKIDTYNAAILMMCEEKQVYYLSVCDVFKDATGALPNEASPNDGMHFGISYYEKWFDYVSTHVVTAE